MPSPDAAPSDLAAAFAASPELAGLLPETLQALAAAAARVHAPAGTYLFEGALAGDALYLVLEGRLEAVEPRPGGELEVLRTLEGGEAVDELQLLAGAPLPARVRAAADTVLARVPDADADRLEAAHPDLRETLRRVHRRQLLCRLHRLLGALDAGLLDALERDAGWVHLPRGQLLFEQDDPAGGIFFVVSGRVALERVDRDGSARVLAQMGRGETVGEMAFFVGEPRLARARALRDSVLVELTQAELEALVARRPSLLRNVARGLVERIHRAAAGPPSPGRIATVAVVPASPGAPLAPFAARLAEALAAHGPTLRLDAAAVDRLTGEPGLAQAWDDAAESARLLAWLEGVEAAHAFVVLEAEPRVSAWTRRCVRQADRVLLLARAGDDPGPGEVERGLMEVERGAAGAGRSLVLVHPEGTNGHPCGTRRWLEARAVEAHHHLRWGDAGDLARVTRHVAGRSVGLVLGGGGARGFAHIGAVRALHEMGVPIDLVAGTSMGAALAAQVAMGWSPAKMAEVNRRVWLEIRPHRVFTLPLVSVLSNARAEVCGRMMYGELEIEDLWIPYFCVSADLATAEAVVHRRGSLDRATAASTALPGIAPPILQDGHLLVDGALLNNLPADLMRAAGAGTVIAAEVSLEEDAAFVVDRVPTTRELLRSRFGRGDVRYPSLMEVVMRASMLHSIARQREAIDLADLTLRPPVDAFGMMEFHRLEEIAEVGYAHAREAVAAWRAKQAAGAAVDFPVPAG